MYRVNLVQKISTQNYVLFFPKNSENYDIMWKKWYSGKDHAWKYYTAHVFGG
jgi:hypothetical protein